MGTGAVIIGLSAQALTWSLISTVVLLIVRSLTRTKRVGWIYWILAVFISSISHGLIMFSFPGYANSSIGEMMTSIRIFLVPLVLLSVFLGIFTLVAHRSK
jgi:hypothetical protein